MRKKNLKLFGIAGTLVIINLIFFTTSSGTFSSSRDYTVGISDTSQISAIQLTRGETKNRLTRNGAGWILNQEYDTDPGYTRILLAVLNRMAVKRTLGETQLEELKTRLSKDAVLVEMEGVNRSFHVLGNRTFTKTFLIEPNLKVGYEVEIPGYRDFVGGIFQLTTDQWRDRTIFKGNFHTIQQIEIVREGEALLDIALNERYFEIAGLDAFDTTALVNYLNQFSYIQANERLSPGKFPRYDSLLNTTDKERMIIGDVGLAEPLILEIYPELPGENFRLAVVNGEEMTVFASNRVPTWFKKTEDFTLKTP